MSHGDVKHDYHLVNPSPYPLIGSIAATVMAMGGVAWMKGLFGIEKGDPWLFFAGLAGVLFTMAGWWREVVKEANQGDHTPVVSIGLRYGMILFIASEVMFFVAWF
jgi:cytochrome c oxidase subunit 3